MQCKSHVMQQPELADFEPMIETTSGFSSDCLFLLLEQAIKRAKPSPQDEFAKSKTLVRSSLQEAKEKSVSGRQEVKGEKSKGKHEYCLFCRDHKATKRAHFK